MACTRFKDSLEDSDINAYTSYAGVVELVDAPDSKSGAARRVGSSPTTRTTYYLLLITPNLIHLGPT